MINPFITKKRIGKIYRPSAPNSYSFRFYEDLSASFSFTLNEKERAEDFFAFEPRGCIAETLLHATSHNSLNYKLQQTVHSVMHSMLMYGHAYIYLQPQYIQPESNENTNLFAEQTISALDIGEVKGIIKQKIGDKYIFYRKGIDDEIIETNLLADGLISLNIKEMGYRKKYFSNLIKKLGTYDVLSCNLLTENTEGYDYNIHSRIKRLAFLKKTKSIGWTFGNDDLSDSYILYRKILLDKFRIKALDFILYKINEGLSTCLHNPFPGKLVAHIRRLDYDQIWKQYTKGELTVTEVNNLLYKIH